MMKKRNVNSVLMKQKYIKKPKEEMSKSTKYLKNNKAAEKNSSQQLSLAIDINDLSNSDNNNKSSKPKKSNNQKSSLSERLNKLKFEYEAALQTKKKLEAEVHSAKAKATKIFSQTSDSAELNTNLQILRQKLNKTQIKYKANLKLLEQMRSQLDDYRTARFQIISARKNKENASIETPKQKEILKKDSNPIINELNRRSNELFQKTDEYQSILGNVIDLTGMKNINEVFYEAERIERENKNIDYYLTTNEPILPKMVERRDELKKICDELTTQRHKESECQNDILHDMSIDFSNIQVHLSEIETQKKKDENSFSDVFFEIEQIYEILGCDFDDISNDVSRIGNSFEEEKNDKEDDNKEVTNSFETGNSKEVTNSFETENSKDDANSFETENSKDDANSYETENESNETEENEISEEEEEEEEADSIDVEENEKNESNTDNNNNMANENNENEENGNHNDTIKISDVDGNNNNNVINSNNDKNFESTENDTNKEDGTKDNLNNNDRKDDIVINKYSINNTSNDNINNNNNNDDNNDSNNSNENINNDDINDKSNSNTVQNLKIDYTTPVMKKEGRSRVNFTFNNITPRFKSQQDFESPGERYCEDEEEEEDLNEPSIRINQQNVLHALSIIEVAVRKLVEKQISLSDENDYDQSSQRIDSDSANTSLLT